MAGPLVAVFKREIKIILSYPIYVMCMVVLPLFITVFFTSLMDQGQPLNMPIGIVDDDNTSTTRRLTRMIDSFQNSHVVAHYPTVDDARRAIQRNEIYGFVYFPQHLTSDIISSRQPRMSVYYTNTSITVGALLFKDMKTMCTLANAGVGRTTMRARGFTPEQITAYLQPISLDMHMIGNPWVNYQLFLCAAFVPAMFMLFIFLLTTYSLGTEIKFDRHKEWLATADNNIFKAVYGKLLPQTLTFSLIMFVSMSYMFGILHFPAPGGEWRLMLLALLGVLGAQGFAVFLYGLIPSLRMSMSVCSLLAVLSFSMVGVAFPVFAMDSPLQAIAWIFPMRHYYLIYQLCVFNTYPLSDAIAHILMLILFALLPLLVMRRMRRAVNEFGYQA